MNIRIVERASSGAAVATFKPDAVAHRDGATFVFPQQSGALTRRKALSRARMLVRAVLPHKDIQALAVSWADILPESVSTSELEHFAEVLCSHALAASYEFDTYKSKSKKNGNLTLELVGAPKKLSPALERAAIINSSLTFVRTVANSPASDVTPASFAATVTKLFKGIAKTKVTVLTDAQLEKMGAGALIGVGKGSTHKPRLIVVEYSGGKKGQAPVSLVGKGITFDSGGLQVKPSSGGSMHEMHMDMSGGASVIGAIHAAAQLKVPQNVVAIVPAAENMISSTSYRPGDILTSLSGKTIEVLNTDAEGRLVLADGLTYTQQKHKPKLIVDVATLTGAALVALGDVAHVHFATSDELAERVKAAGESVGEYTWQLPMWEEYTYMVRSDRADIANIPSEAPRYGGTINGAMFLKEFIEPSVAWVHIDMAPRMTASSRDYLGKGATGEPTRLLLELIRTA